MRLWKSALGGFAILSAASSLAPVAACEVNRPVVIAGLNWDSNAFHTAVAARILKDGYGCNTEIAAGTTRPLFKSMAGGDVDITMEVWKDNLPKLWPEAIRKDQVVDLGVNMPDAIQGWFVPRYAIEGVSARAPGLTNVADLPRYKQVFADPEERSKGRFYNCMLGWGCEKVNSAKLHAYGLTDHFTNFRTASGAALVKAIRSHYEKREPFLAYYWGPTWVLGEYDLVCAEGATVRSRRLEAVGPRPQANTGDSLSCLGDQHRRQCRFAADAPQIIAFLRNYKTSNLLVSGALADMNRSGKDATEAAETFLITNRNLWRSWLPEAIADRVDAGLKGS